MAFQDWTITQNDIKHPPVFDEKTMKYLVCQAEIAPGTGHPHWQGYVEFTCKRQMKTVQRLCECENAHVEGRKGSRKQARDYCMKTESRAPGKPENVGPFVFGNWDPTDEDKSTLRKRKPEDEKRPGKRTDLDRAYAYAKKGLFEGIPGSMMLRYRRAIMETYALECSKLPKSKPLVVVLTGPTGINKSRYSFDIGIAFANGDEELVYSKPPGAWFDGYRGQPIAIIDEYSGENDATRSESASLLLRALDRYKVDLPVKGGFVSWRPKLIIITSHFPVKRWHEGREKEILRRIDILEERETPVPALDEFLLSTVSGRLPPDEEKKLEKEIDPINVDLLCTNILYHLTKREMDDEEEANKTLALRAKIAHKFGRFVQTREINYFCKDCKIIMKDAIGEGYCDECAEEDASEAGSDTDESESDNDEPMLSVVPTEPPAAVNIGERPDNVGEPLQPRIIGKKQYCATCVTLLVNNKCMNCERHTRGRFAP